MSLCCSQLHLGRREDKYGRSFWSKGIGVLDLITVFDKLPKTIRDAIDVALGLGERYLWIDSVI
jgi:hypothetical protein